MEISDPLAGEEEEKQLDPAMLDEPADEFQMPDEDELAAMAHRPSMIPEV